MVKKASFAFMVIGLYCRLQYPRVLWVSPTDLFAWIHKWTYFMRQFALARLLVLLFVFNGILGLIFIVSLLPLWMKQFFKYVSVIAVVSAPCWHCTQVRRFLKFMHRISWTLSVLYVTDELLLCQVCYSGTPYYSLAFPLNRKSKLQWPCFASKY